MFRSIDAGASIPNRRKPVFQKSVNLMIVVLFSPGGALVNLARRANEVD